VLPLVMGLVALPLGAVVGRFTWDWFADRPPGIDFGSEFEGYDWVIGFASVAALNAPTSIGNEASAVSDTEADEMEEHPRGLGYLE